MNNLEKMQKLKQVINAWAGSYNPTHFLTLRLPENMESANDDVSERALKKIMSAFEYRLLGRHWHKKHLPFIATAEKGHGEAWHYHILFNQQNFSDEELNTAIFKTVTALHLPLYSLKLEPITAYKDYVVSYCSKEMRVVSDIIDTDRIIPSHVLFDIPVKNQNLIK